MFWIIIILAVNGVISFWNACVCGLVWNESKQEGGWIRLLVWCAAVQSAIGFSSIYMIGLLGLLTVFADEALRQNLDDLWRFVMSFWYVTVIFPALGSGLVIMIHSWQEAMRRRDFGSVGVAAWNTYAQVSNTVSAVSNLGGVWETVGQGFKVVFEKGGDKDAVKAKVMILGILVVIVALLAGVLTTVYIIKHYAAKAVRMHAKAVA